MTLILNWTPAGAYTLPPTLQDAVNRLRMDLFDRTQNLPAGTSQRWADDDLARALDRAIDEYSHIKPLVQAAMINTLPQCRAYVFPTGAFWIQDVEYPSGFWPIQFQSFEEYITPSLLIGGTAPAAPTAVVAAGPGQSGSYQWGYTFAKSGGETTLSVLSQALTLSNQNATVTVPTGPPGTVYRNVYRYKGGLLQGYVGQLLDNVSTLFTDTVSDATAAAGAAPPTTDTTANLQQLVMKLNTSKVPADTSGIITVRYGAKHQLTTAGTSVPEQHHDVVLLGAAAYAVMAYAGPTNDLFEYQDGELRDRVDERSIPGQWLAAGTALLQHFKDRLETIKRQNNAAVAAVATWGDEPIRWQRT